MQETLILSSRGQVTLPASLRKQLGLEPGSALVVEARDGELRLRPAAVLPLATYSDAEIAAWDSADTLDPAERQRIIARLQKA